MIQPIPRHLPIRSKSIRKAAAGEQCTVNVVGVCNGDPETTVLAHLPSESHGLARKSDDFPCAVFACHACHDWLDRRANLHRQEMREWYMRRAMERTIRRLMVRGLVEVKS